MTLFVSWVAVVFFCSSCSTPALQSALLSGVQLQWDRVSTRHADDSNEMEAATQRADDGDGDAEARDNGNDFYKTWYDAAVSQGVEPGEPAVHYDHDIPEEEFDEVKSQDVIGVIGGDAPLSSELQEEAMPEGQSVGVPSANETDAETDPHAVIKNPKQGAAGKARASDEDAGAGDEVQGADVFVIPSIPTVDEKVALLENAVHGIDEFVDPEVEMQKKKKEKKEEAAKAVKEASEKKAKMALDKLLGKPVAKLGEAADDAEASGRSSETSHSMSLVTSLVSLLGQTQTAKQAAAEGNAKMMPSDVVRRDDVLHNGMRAFFSWNMSSLFLKERAALIFLGVVFVVIATRVRQKHQASVPENMGMHASEEQLAKDAAPASSPLEDDAKLKGEDSMNLFDAVPPPSKEERVSEPKQHDKLTRQNAARSGASWLVRRMGLICSAQ